MPTTTLNPTADTYIVNPGGNFGNAVTVAVGQLVALSSVVPFRGLWRFDLASFDGQVIEQAILRLYLRSALFHDIPHEFTVHELTTLGWVELEARHDRAAVGLPWVTSMGDFVAEAAGSAMIAINQSELDPPTVLDVDLTGLAQEKNGGLLDLLGKLPETGDSHEHYFVAHSREAEDEDLWPRLLVTWDYADGEALQWSTLGKPIHYTAEAVDEPPLEWTSRHNHMHWTGA